MSDQYSSKIRESLSPLLFIVVMVLISRKVIMIDTTLKLLNADNLSGGSTTGNLKGYCIEFKYYADGIHSGLTPPG